MSGKPFSQIADEISFSELNFLLNSETFAKKLNESMLEKQQGTGKEFNNYLKQLGGVF